MHKLNPTSVLILCFSIILIFAGCTDRVRETEESNKELVRYITEEGVNKHNPDKWDEVLTEDYVRHCEAMPPELQEIRGIETMKGFLKEHFAAFPDWRESIDLMIAEGDKVAYITTGTGTQTGQMGPFPPSNKQCNVKTFIVHRFEDGKIAESWVSWDNVAFLTQLGHFPPPSPDL